AVVTAPTAVQFAPLLSEYSQWPLLALVLLMAMPSAGESGSVMAPRNEATVWPALLVWSSSIPVSARLGGVSTGASLVATRWTIACAMLLSTGEPSSSVTTTVMSRSSVFGVSLVLVNAMACSAAS